ncbi:hypothetical protein Q7A53_15250 [Halobacillus rhizosphaerae]|uniref:hypothetical protein n=1 Tax=Halobacillus rhizosphaerae TaxID=3064889 RepID=UPI00398A8F6D
MKEVIILLADIVNAFHDFLIQFASSMGWDLTDKDLHFWVIGILGIIGLLVVEVVFHALAKWSISAISFLFTLSMVLVFVFAVEIQQKITHRGNMEFQDAAVSVLGFLAFALGYFLLRGFIKLAKR